jgi:hypothetical protein
MFRTVAILYSGMWCLALMAAPSASAQVWEKRLADGFVYRMELDESLPRVIHAIKWSPRSEQIKAVAELAGGTVYESGPSAGRKTLSAMVKDAGALGGINADFFPWTGDPLGLMIRDGRLISTPFPNRPAFGWNMDRAVVGNPTIEINAVVNNLTIKMNSINTTVLQDEIGVFTDDAGTASAKGSATGVRLKILEGDWKLGQDLMAQVIGPYDNKPVQKGECVILASGSQRAAAEAFTTGQKVRFTVAVSGAENWADIKQAVGGGPTLVRKGLVVNEWRQQGFDEAFSNRKHPRTAVGITVEGDLWFVVLDGRLSFSQGATIEELARVMQRLGCMEAINLDGGGSSTFNLFGATVNRPSEGKEREIANAILFMGNSDVKVDPNSKIVAPQTVKANTKTLVRMVDSNNQPVPNRNIIWSVTGSGWIDQGGNLRATAPGTIFVTAWAGGKTYTAGIQVTN